MGQKVDMHRKNGRKIQGASSGLASSRDAGHTKFRAAPSRIIPQQIVISDRQYNS